VDSELREGFRTVVVSKAKLLFINLILEAMMAQASKHMGKESVGITILGDTVIILRFADDIDLLADTEESLQKLTAAVDTTSEQYGLKINTTKT